MQEFYVNNTVDIPAEVLYFGHYKIITFNKKSLYNNSKHIKF